MSGPGALAAGARQRLWCEYAWLGGATATPSVCVEIAGDRFVSVEPGPPSAGATRLAGLSLPGFANAHSHAFHRGLRGRSERGPGDFWTWRTAMYELAEQLDPERYLDLATAVFAEMVLGGYTSVGEFHYLHHDRNGHPYSEPNVMGAVLVEAASRAGLRITVLDTCYLEGGPGVPLEGTQLRFGDPDADAWAARVGELRRAVEPSAGFARVGAAIHSARAVPPAAAALVAGVASSEGMCLHAHLSEQPLENDSVRAAYEMTPAAVLDSSGALGPRCTVVHATHLDAEDIRRLAASSTSVCMCPTTERDLADGIGPAHELARRGSPICLGSDSQAVIDPFEEMRAVELDERLASRSRGRFAAAELLSAGSAAGQRAIGWPEAGAIAPGALADLVTVSLDSPRLAGSEPAFLLEQVVFAAGAADVTEVVVSGRRVVSGGRHAGLDVPAALRAAIAAARGR